MRGVNPKDWFYGFREHLNARPALSRVALATTAAEQWLNGEFAGWLSSNLPPTLTVVSESEKRDLSILRVVDGHANWEQPVAALELKLVYRSYSDAKVATYAEDLVAKMQVNCKLGIPSYGWFGSVFNAWDARGLTTRATPGEQHRRSGRILRNVTASGLVTSARKTMETVLKPSAVQVGGIAWNVGLAAQYLVMGQKLR